MNIFQELKNITAIEKDAFKRHENIEVVIFPEKITIASGNGEYTLTQSEESKKVAQTSISSDKKEIVIKAITEGKISVEITDVLAKKSASLEISVLSKVTPQDYELSQDKKT